MSAHIQIFVCIGSHSCNWCKNFVLISIMNINIRRAVKKDCERILELVKELAKFERAAKEVTVTLEHFTDSVLVLTRYGGLLWPK